MRKITIFLLGVLLGIHFSGFAQNEERDRVITTTVPFLMVAADARAAGMGDQGVATAPDVFSQQWNPAKYAFAKKEHGIGVSYTPYLREVVDDIFLGSINYFNRINERSAFAASLRYFGLGTIETRVTSFSEPLPVSPNELSFDLSYALRLSENFSMAVAGRYLRSDLGLQDERDLGAANSFGVDIGGYFQSNQLVFSNFNGQWKAGANISNIGPKMKYDDAGQENFIPTNFRLGGGFDFIFDTENRLGTYIEFNKLLVPTPRDFNGNGTVFDSEDEAEYNSIGAIEGIFTSWGDAPGGLGEELRETTWAVGAEYLFKDQFAFRTGYFNENQNKGARRFLSFGAGFTYESVNIDLSYLFSTSRIKSPLEGGLRFALTFNFGDQYVY